MKVFFTGVVLLAWVWLCALSLQAQTVAPERLLIIEVSAADESAALRLSGLTTQPVARLRDESARDPTRAHAALMMQGAARAAVLDTLERRVHVVERDGSVHTRLIDGEPTAYLVAFVASELLMLDSAAPPPVQPTPVLARFDGQLALDVAHAYTTAWVVRPRLSLGFWFSSRRTPRALPLLGLTLAGPARVERNAEEGRLSVRRWDGAVRLGLALPFGRARLLTYAQAQAAFQHADYSGTLGVEQRAVSLGLGLGVALELGLLHWLSLSAGFELSSMLRRNLFTLHDQLALRDHFLLPSASLGLVAHTPWP
jgi:hypothetical protein